MKTTPLIFSLALTLLAASQAHGESSLEKLNGNWNCDGAASLEYLPQAKCMDATDRALWAEQLDAMGITIDIEEQVIALNLGNLKGVRSFTVLSDEGLTVELQSDDTYTIEIQDDATILFADPIDEEKKVVLRRP